MTQSVEVDEGTRQLDETAEARGCVLIWMIEPPAGTTSAGVCTLCRATKDFLNSLEGDEWANEVAARAREHAGQAG